MTRLDSIKEDIGVSINQKDIIENKIKASLYDEEKYEQILYNFERYERRKNTFNEELFEIKGRAKESIVSLQDLTDKIKMASQFRQEYDNIDEYIGILKHIRELYSRGGIQKDLRNISRPAIQKHTKEYFKEFNFNYSDLTIDDDYEVTVGITQAMANGELDTILLDEPTIHLDASRKHELINLLKEMSSLPQMIIVTHEAQLENAAENLIKVEKENGISKVIM